MDNVILSPLPEDGKYVVWEDFEYDDTVVPAGFLTDGASIPRFFWRLFGHPFSPKFINESVAHDWDYHNHKDRKKADKKFLKRLRAQGNSRIKSWLMYGAVRAFGWTRYMIVIGAGTATLTGPITDSPVHLDAYKYGATIESPYFDLRIGTPKEQENK